MWQTEEDTGPPGRSFPGVGFEFVRKWVSRYVIHYRIRGFRRPWRQNPPRRVPRRRGSCRVQGDPLMESKLRESSWEQGKDGLGLGQRGKGLGTKNSDILWKTTTRDPEFKPGKRSKPVKREREVNKLWTWVVDRHWVDFSGPRFTRGWRRERLNDGPLETSRLSGSRV